MFAHRLFQVFPLLAAPRQPATCWCRNEEIAKLKTLIFALARVTLMQREHNTRPRTYSNRLVINIKGGIKGGAHLSVVIKWS